MLTRSRFRHMLLQINAGAKGHQKQHQLVQYNRYIKERYINNEIDLHELL